MNEFDGESKDPDIAFQPQGYTREVALASETTTEARDPSRLKASVQ